MSDPAAEAAHRQLVNQFGIWEKDRTYPNGEPYYMVRTRTEAAREALKPIRAVLDKLAEDTIPPCDFATQVELFAKAINDLSPLVYSTEELANG